jgi:hypothetical protein
MASPLDTLKAGGFSDEEVGQWAAAQRSTLSAAGFGDDEIDTYLGGPRKPVPTSLIDRLSAGTAILDGRVPVDRGAYAEAAMTGGPAPFIAGLWKGLTTPGAELKQSLQDKSFAETAGAIVGRVPIGQIIDQIRQGGESLGAAMTGQPVSAEEMVGNAMLGLTAPVTRLPGGTMTRLERAPQGHLREAPIGGLPEPGEYGASAHVTLGGPVPPYVADKVERLWDQHGIHPGEVAHDAQTNVTIAQDLASSTGELPQTYVEKGMLPGAPLPATRLEITPTVEPSTPRPPLAAEAPAELRSFAPGDLKVDASRFQFKEGADLAGVTDRLQGVTQWDPIKSGVGIVFEDKDGIPYVVDGHQRLALASRIAEADPAQQPRFLAHVLREADGITDAHARAVAAAKNIAEGTGTAVDAAKVLRDRPDLADNLPPRSELVRQAQGLSNLSPEAFGMVVNDVVPANYAAIVGRLVPGDAKMQGAILDLIAKAEPANAVQAESIVRQGMDAGLHTETQATLFGDRELVSSLYAGRARILDRALKTLRRDRTLFQSIADNRAIVEQLGNKLAQNENLQRAAADAQAVQILQTLANRRGALGDALTGAARAVADGSSDVATATRDFVAEIRRQAASGDLARIADGGTGSPLATPGAGGAVRPVAGRSAAEAREGVAKQPAEPVIAPSAVEEAAANNATQAAIRPPTAPEPNQLSPEMQRVMADNTAKAEQSREGGVAVVKDQLQYLAKGGASEREADTVIRRAIEAETGRGGDVTSFLDEAGATGDQKARFGTSEAAGTTAAERAGVPAAPATERTAQGEQFVMPGAERSAVQAAAAREAEGHGRVATSTPQQEPGGLFAEKPAEQPDIFANPEAGALRVGTPGPTLTPAEQAIRQSIDFDAKREHRWSFSRFYTAMVDKLHPVEEAVSAVGGEALPTAQHPYKLMRLLAGGPGKAEGWIKYGQRDFATGDKIGPGLQEILAPVEGDLERFDIFATSVRALELDRRGIETGKNVAAARQVAAAGVDKYGPVLAHLIQYQDNLSKYLRDAGVLSPEGYEAMREANRLYVPFYRIFGDEEIGSIGGGGSLQPQNPIKRIKGSERETVPALESIMRNTFLYLTMAERNAASTTLVDLLRFERDAHGRVRDVSLTHPRDVTATPARVPQTPPPTRAGEAATPRPDLFPERGPIPTEDLAAARPVPPMTEAGVADAVREMLADHGLSDELFDFVASAAPPAEGEIRIFRNGRAETWQVGRDVAEAVKALNQDSANTLVRMLAAPARALRAGATLTPDFLLRNVIRDFFSAFVNTTKGLFTPLDTAKGLASAVMKDEHFQRWLDAGGGNATLVAMDRRYLQESLRALNASTGLMDRAWNVVRHPIDALRLLSELSEQSTRLGEFRAVRARELARGMSEKEAAQAAAFASREATIDFARSGAQTRSMNMITAFWNAGIQGVDRDVRAWRDKPIGTGLKVAAGITLPSVLLWWANHDDPDFQEIPGWQKDLFWLVGSGSTEPSPLHIQQAQERGEPPKPSYENVWRIPKPFGPGVLFGSSVERLLDAYVAQRPDAWANFSKSVMNALSPGMVPTFVLPFVEQWANRSYFTDRNLIPKSLEGQLPEIQYTPYTTETAKKLGQLIAAFPGVRETGLGGGPAAGVATALSTPILLENYLRAWTGGLGTYALQIADAGLRKAGVVPDPVTPETKWPESPVIRAFHIRWPSAAAESIQLFYDDYTRNKRYFDSWRAKAQEGDVAALERIQGAGGARMFVQLDGIHTVLDEHSDIIRRIWNDPGMPPAEKRQLIDGLYYSAIQIAQAGREAMRQADRALAGAPQ